MTRPNDAAFARPASELGQTSWGPVNGLTKREYFAAMALAGLCAADSPIPVQVIGEMAVRRADMLISELAKGGEQ